MTSALRSNPRFGWRPWLAAIGLAVALHLPLLWVQLQRNAAQDEPTQMVELLLTPPEPIPVSPPSDWANDLELKWTLGGEPDPTQTTPDFEALKGLELADSALSGQLTGLPSRAADAAPDPEPATTSSPTPVPDEAPNAEPPQDPEVASAPSPEPATQPGAAPVEPAPTTQSEPTLPNIEAAIETALAGTASVRTTPSEIAEQAPAQPTDDAPEEPPETTDDAVEQALAQTGAVRTPGALPAASQAILDRPPPEPAPSAPPADTPAPATQRVPQPRPEARPPTRQAPPQQQQAQADAQYRPDGAAGAYSSDRNAFFSNLAEHLFTVNDARLRARPYNRRQIVDVRFSIDRQGRVMRVWTPAPVQSAATEAAKAVIWAASPVPQLAPDMPQAALELTFPVIVGQ